MLTFKSAEDLDQLDPEGDAHPVMRELVDLLIVNCPLPRPYDPEVFDLPIGGMAIVLLGVICSLASIGSLFVMSADFGRWIGLRQFDIGFPVGIAFWWYAFALELVPSPTATHSAKILMRTTGDDYGLSLTMGIPF